MTNYFKKRERAYLKILEQVTKYIKKHRNEKNSLSIRECTDSLYKDLLKNLNPPW
jgi:hypothetical protein